MTRPPEDHDPLLTRYLASIHGVAPLDRDAELDLARRYREGDTRAGHRLVEAHLRSVVKIALGYRGYGIRVLDLVEEGNLGLLEALERFDPARNLRFLTYAAYWVRAFMLGHILRQWSLVGVGTGPAQSRMFFRLNAERSRLVARLGDGNEAIEATLARKFGTSQDRVRGMTERLAARDMSLDGAAYRDGPSTLLDLLEDHGKSQEDALADAERDGQVRAALAGIWDELDFRERMIVEQRLLVEGEPTTLADLGGRLGLSRERVRQLEERVKGKLREVLEPVARAA